MWGMLYLGKISTADPEVFEFDLLIKCNGWLYIVKITSCYIDCYTLVKQVVIRKYYTYVLVNESATLHSLLVWWLSLQLLLALEKRLCSLYRLYLTKFDLSPIMVSHGCTEEVSRLWNKHRAYLGTYKILADTKVTMESHFNCWHW